MQEQIICKIHKMSALIFDGRLSFQQQVLCKECAKQQQIYLIYDYINSQNSIQEKVETLDSNQMFLKDLIEGLQQYKLEFQKAFDKILSVIVQQDKIIQQSNSKVPGQKHKTIKKEKTKDQKKKQLQIINKVKQTLNNELTELQNASKIDRLFEIINNNSPQMDLEVIESNKMVQEEVNLNNFAPIPIPAEQIFDKKLNYQLIKQPNCFQAFVCQAIAFNSNTTLMIAGFSEKIKLFEFQDGKINEIKILKGHSHPVTVLQFLKKSNQFISASDDSTIIIWECQENNQWEKKQVLEAHKSYIHCLVINEKEDLMISGSFDKKIKFWVQQNDKWMEQQSIDCESDIFSIGLNQKEDIFIASLESKQILVIQFQGKKWIIKQTIEVEQYGHRVCYIDQNQFIFQPIEGKYLQLYDFDSEEQTFKMGQQIQYQNKTKEYSRFFPIRYIKQIGLILAKDGQFIHIIRRKKNDQFVVDQSINFGSDSICGTISDDGKFIATFDRKSDEFQIRKLKI